ncbi:hypothetical protein BR93DRAFT_447434 [Coniochaeta sp. PMI_546]|nr:hypothetical protein BR93DRAFT_447434 [Coniochaeta sp. PMI_546]
MGSWHDATASQTGSVDGGHSILGPYNSSDGWHHGVLWYSAFFLKSHIRCLHQSSQLRTIESSPPCNGGGVAWTARESPLPLLFRRVRLGQPSRVAWAHIVLAERHTLRDGGRAAGSQGQLRRIQTTFPAARHKARGALGTVEPNSK